MSLLIMLTTVGRGTTFRWVFFFFFCLYLLLWLTFPCVLNTKPKHYETEK